MTYQFDDKMRIKTLFIKSAYQFMKVVIQLYMSYQYFT